MVETKNSISISFNVFGLVFVICFLIRFWSIPIGSILIWQIFQLFLLAIAITFGIIGIILGIMLIIAMIV